MKDFNLSEKKVKDLSNEPIPNYYWEKDVKEKHADFFKELEEFVSPKDPSNVLVWKHFEIVNIINKLRTKHFGKELVK